MRETRVVAVTVTIAAAAGVDIVDIVLLWVLLAVLVVITSSRSTRMLDHRVQSLMHASDSGCTSCCAVRDIFALPLRLRERSLCRWAESSGKRRCWDAGRWA